MINIENIIKESLRRQLNEITSRFVYHWASPSTAWKIINENRFSLMSTLFKRAESNLVGASHNNLYYMSLTRNGKIGQGGYSQTEHSWVRFTLNGDMLNSNFHIKALDYWGGNMGKNYRMSGNMSKVMNPFAKKPIIHKPGQETESEDRLYSRKPIINDAFNYIEHIDLYFDMDNVNDMNIIYLPYVYNIMINFGRYCTLYKTIKDFNSNKNPIDSSDFFDWYRNNEFKYEHRYSSRENANVSARFLASAVYLVNFPYSNLQNCMRTLKKYGLEKYAKPVAKELEYNGGYVFDFMKNTYYNDTERAKQLLFGVIEGNGILYNIQLGNDAQGMNRDDLSKGYQIITDFCNRHKIKNLYELSEYLLGIVSDNNPDNSNINGNDTIEVPCIHIQCNENRYYVCINPDNSLYEDIIPNGKDYLQYLYDDIEYETRYNDLPHKSKNVKSFLKYIKKIFNKPTVSQVIDICDKIRNLGVEIDAINDYCPIIANKKINGWQCNTLTYNSNHSNYEHLDDGGYIYLTDKKQIKQLMNLWNNRIN